MSLATRFLNKFRPFNSERDFDDEVDFHLQMRVEKHVQHGMTEAEAETMAHNQFGDIDAVKRGMRQARSRSLRLFGAGITAGAIVLIGLWLYDASRPPNVPSLPKGMEFVSGPPRPR